jgi:hypothetical protein
MLKHQLYVRIKDSTAILTGQWYSTMHIGTKFLGVEQTIENNTYRIKNTSGAEKSCFNEMNSFALSFKKPVEYLIIK